MKLKIFAIAALILTLANKSFAQYQLGKTSNGLLPNVLPVSPEASSLGKFGEWPVSYYTGTANVSIPIYQIKTGGFELPINLSYHTGGVKVDEIPSWVGTSWTLNAGGAIVRSTVGLPDEEENGFLTRNLANKLIKTSYDLNNRLDHAALKKVVRQEIDTEPDLFFYNFGGFSGKFFFDSQGNFQSIPVNSLKVLTSPIKNPGLSYWEIADESGNKFYFGIGYPGIQIGGLEYTATFSRPQSGGAQSTLEQVSSWYLTKVVPNNNSAPIYLDYVEKSESYYQAPVYSYKIMDNVIVDGNNNGNVMGELPNYKSILKVEEVLRNGIAFSNTTYSPTKIIISGKSQLNKIRWGEGEINFEAVTDRQDILGKNLNKITVFNNSLKKIKETRFFHSFRSDRYYLDSLVDYSVDLKKNSSHKFEYESPEQLPPKHSSAQDHWGYYNGANSNTHLLPQYFDLVAPAINANRESQESFMKTGTLKRITFPTGGTTDFQYEANRYEGQAIPGGSTPPVNTGTAVHVNASEPQEPGWSKVENFGVSTTQQVTIQLRFKNYGKPPSKRGGVLPIVKIEQLFVDSYGQVQYWDAFDCFPTTPVPNQNNLYDFELTKTFTIQAGTYRITADLLPEVLGLGDPLPIMPEVRAIMGYQFSSPSSGGTTIPNSVYLTGGLRIKQITNMSNGVVTSSKQFAYSPGKLLMYPKYVHEYSENVNMFLSSPALCGTLSARYKEIISTGQTVLGFTQGSPVGYLNVQERSMSSLNEENGYTDYKYSFEPDLLNEMHFNTSFWVDQIRMNKTVPLNNNEYKRGLLLEKDVYKKNQTGTFTKLFNLKNEYELNDGNVTNRYKSLKALRVKRMRFVDYECGELYDGVMLPEVSDISKDLAYSFYDVFTGWVQTKSTTETSYDQNGENPIVSKTDFTYDNPLHLQATSITKIKSNVTIDKQTLLYPHEMVSSGRDPSGVYQGMITKNIISPVIEQKNEVNGKAKLQLTNYIQPTTGIFVPGSVSILNTSSGLNETRLNYHTYDDRGNPVSLSLEKGPKVSYIWSYNKQHPIAEIKNADYAAVVTALGGATAVNDFANSIPTSKTVIDDFLAPIRNSLTTFKEAQIISYSYEPLVGIRSVTDAKGMATYYEYDEFQRLKAIKNDKGEIIKSYDYHYKP